MTRVTGSVDAAATEPVKAEAGVGKERDQRSDLTSATPAVQRTKAGPENFDPNAEFCPSCGVRWWTEPIPDDHWTDGPKEGYPTHYSSLISRYDRPLDRTIAWSCPACKKEWPRWLTRRDQ